MSAIQPSPSSLGAWVLAARPATLTAAVAPVCVGTALSLSLGSISPGPMLATFLGAMLLQVGSNFANDVFDYEKGTDTQERLGPTRAVQAGLLSAEQMKRGMVAVFVLALLVGLYLTSVAGPVIVAIGLLSIVAAIAYTGGPFPLGYHGLGDIFVMLFFGFVAVCGTTFVHLGQVPESALLSSLVPGALATNILVVNNVRDRQTDVLTGKRTLAVRFGRRAAEVQYVGLVFVAYLVPLVLWLRGHAGVGALLCWLTLPLALRNIRQLLKLEGRALNAVLVNTAKLVFVVSFLLAIGLIAPRLLGGTLG
jgi:1,4-dihydroxy-2-naphthoate octaprenyltransferase